MKIWGSIAELVSARFRRDGQQITLKPNDSVTYNADINVSLPPQITGSVLVSADSQQTLTNKTFDADGTGNVLSNVEDDNIKVGAAIARTKLASGSNDHVVINSAAGVMSSEQYLSKTRGGTGITSTATFPASGTVAVTGDKLSAFASTTSAELAGVISDETGSGALVFGTSPSLTTPSLSLATLSSYSTTTAAANSTITPASDRPVIILNVLTSNTINSVAGPSNGKQVFLVNNGLGDLTINDNSGSPATNGIRTGTGQSFTLKSNASVSLLYNSDMNRWVLSGGAGGSGGGTLIRVNGGAGGYPVGTPVYYSGSNVLPASAAVANTAEVIGLVSAEPSSGVYDVLLTGAIDVVSASAYDTGIASAAGTILFLSPTAGKLTAVEPSIIGQVSLPLGVSQGGTGVLVAPKRGVVLGGTNARTQLNLVSAAATQIFDAVIPSLYQAGELTGWVQLGTSQKFYFRAPFAQNGAGSDWNISPSYVGDTPPSGFSITMASTGKVTMTCPTFTGTGLVNYALNAPAVGATFPLAVDASSLTTGTVAAARLPNIDTATLTNTGITGLTGTAATNAVASGSNKIGEKVTWTTAPGATQALTTTYADWTNATFTLNPGVWMIIASVELEYVTGTTLGNAGYSFAKITDSAGNLIDNCVQSIYARTVGTIANDMVAPVFLSTVQAITSATTYKIQVKRSDASGTGSGVVLNNTTGDTVSKFYAIRIA